MKKTVDERDFIQEFSDFNREDCFSRDALILIFNYIENVYGEETELDVISVCGDYTELPLLQFIEDYDLDIEDWLDDYDYDEDEVEEEFSEHNHLKSVSEIIKECPEVYKDYKILSERLLIRSDDSNYYKVLLSAIYEDDTWKQETTIYFVTDLDYKFKNTARTNLEALEIGNNIDPNEFNITLEEEKDKKELSWEDVDEEKLEEIIAEYITDRGSLVGFTNQGTVVFGDI